MVPTSSPIASTVEISQPTALPTKVGSEVDDDDFPRVVSLILVNAETNQDVMELTNGYVLDVSLLPDFTVRTDTDPSRVGSVVFSLDGYRIKTEDYPPYTIAGDVRSNGNYLSWVVDLGMHDITACPYAKRDGSGAAGECLTVALEIIDSTVAMPVEQPPGSITIPDVSILKLVLVDVKTNREMASLHNGGRLYRRQMPRSGFTIRADPSADVRSVVFSVNDGKYVQTESHAPFAIAGDSRRTGKLTPWKIGPGVYVISVTPYAQPQGKGSPGNTVSVVLTIV